MRIVILVPDDTVYVNGNVESIDFTSLDPSILDPSIRAVQWDGILGIGEIEFYPYDDEGNRKPNEKFTDLSRFQPIYDLWEAEAQKPLVMPELRIPDAS